MSTIEMESRFYDLPNSYDGAKKKKHSWVTKWERYRKVTNGRHTSSWCGRVRIEFRMRGATNVRIYSISISGDNSQNKSAVLAWPIRIIFTMLFANYDGPDGTMSNCLRIHYQQHPQVFETTFHPRHTMIVFEL